MPSAYELGLRPSRASSATSIVFAYGPYARLPFLPMRMQGALAPNGSEEHAPPAEAVIWSQRDPCLKAKRVSYISVGKSPCVKQRKRGQRGARFLVHSPVRRHSFGASR